MYILLIETPGQGAESAQTRDAPNLLLSKENYYSMTQQVYNDFTFNN